jgi:hypothetical protein
MNKTGIYPPKRGPEEARAIAYHEAGHAVVAIVLGLRITSVQLKERRVRGGIAAATVYILDAWKWKDFGPRLRFEFAKLAVTFFFAGYEAQRLVDSTLFSTLMADDDTTQAAYLLHQAKVFPDGRPKYIRGCNKLGDETYWRWLDNRQKEARRIVRWERAAVGAVAIELMRKKRGSFSHEEIEAIVKPLLTSKSLNLRERIYSARGFEELRRRASAIQTAKGS